MRSVPSDEQPVYVYGASGRCWKFRNAPMVNMYFSSLCRGEEGKRCILELLEKYGPAVGERLAVALEESPFINSEDHDFEICITGPDGKEEKSSPRSCIFSYPKANIRIVMPRVFSNRGQADCALAHLIDHKTAPEPMRYDIILFAGGRRGSRESWQLACDYLLGDRVVCTEPRPIPIPLPIPAPVQEGQPAPPRRSGWMGRLFGTGCASSAVAPNASSATVGAGGDYTAFLPLMIEITNTTD